MLRRSFLSRSSGHCHVKNPTNYRASAAMCLVVCLSILAGSIGITGCSNTTSSTEASDSGAPLNKRTAKLDKLKGVKPAPGAK
jgi:hypothetical protein